MKSFALAGMMVLAPLSAWAEMTTATFMTTLRKKHWEDGVAHNKTTPRRVDISHKGGREARSLRERREESTEARPMGPKRHIGRRDHAGPCGPRHGPV